jgi:hypothetical protein
MGGPIWTNNKNGFHVATMERRKTPRKDWVISKDDVGRSVLEWKIDPLRAKRLESDPCARTYDFLNRLDSAELSLEDETPQRGGSRGFNPYDRAQPHHPKKALSD